jgi:hypothetical protein
MATRAKFVPAQVIDYHDENIGAGFRSSGTGAPPDAAKRRAGDGAAD